MKVLHLISGGDTGGAKTHIINLLAELQKKVDIKLICFMKEDFYYEAIEKGINIEILEQKKRYDFSIIKRLIKYIKREKYDIIHCHGARANFITFLLKLFYKIPSITTIHSDYTLDFKGNFYKNLVYTSLNTISLRYMNYYIGVSESFKEMLIERGFDSDKVYTVYNGIDINTSIAPMSKEKFLSKYDIKVDGGTILVGIIARLHPVKGVDVFLKGAKEVLKENKNVIFLIAGDGQDELKLKSLSEELGIDKNVHFLGFVDRPFDLLNAIDINTLTSFSESFPYVILEGALLKKPIVTSDVGGINDLVKEDKTGLLFNSGDEKMLSNKLLKLVNDKELRYRIGQNLFEYVSENYSSESMAKRHVNIYKEILKVGGRNDEKKI